MSVLDRLKDPLISLLHNPAAAPDRVLIYFLSARAETRSSKGKTLRLEWNGTQIASRDFEINPQPPVAAAYADRWAAFQTSIADHSFHLIHSGFLPKSEGTTTDFVSVRKSDGPLVLLLSLGEPNGDSPILIERLQWPDPLWANRLSALARQNASHLLGSGKEGEAAALLLGIQRDSDPTSPEPETLLLLGRAYDGLGLGERSLGVLRTAAQHPEADEGQVLEAWLLIQRAHYRRGAFTEASQVYERLVRRFPHGLQPEMHYLAAQSYLKQKKHGAAIAAFGQIPPNSGFHPYALYGTGLAYLGFGDSYAAQQAFTKLTKPDSILSRPQSPSPLALSAKSRVTLGLLFIEQGRYREAIEMLGGVPLDSRDFDLALFGIGWCYMRSEEYTKAIVAFKDLVARYPTSRYGQEAYLWMAYSYSKLKAYPRAVSSYRDALENTSLRIGRLSERIASLGRAKNQIWGDDGQAGHPQHREIAQNFEKVSVLIRDHPTLSGDKKLISRLRVLEDGVAALQSRIALGSLLTERERLEDLSIQAGIGIAKNLVLEQTEFGKEELFLE